MIVIDFPVLKSSNHQHDRCQTMYVCIEKCEWITSNIHRCTLQVLAMHRGVNYRYSQCTGSASKCDVIKFELSRLLAAWLGSYIYKYLDYFFGQRKKNVRLW